MTRAILRGAGVLLALGAHPAGTASAEAPLDLEALLRAAEAANPEIRASNERQRAAESVPSQAQALPDPLASISYTNESFNELTLGESDDSNLTLCWLQELPYPGKRRLSGDVAWAEVEVATRAVETVRLRVRAQVETLYSDLYRLDRSRAILEESRKLLVSFEEAARARYESGEGVLESVLRAQTEVTRLDTRLATIAQERRGAAAVLNAVLGRADEVPLGPAVALPSVVDLDREVLEDAALSRSPELLELEAAVRREGRRVELAEKNQKPDLMWSAAYANRGGLEPMVTGMFGMRLPLYPKNQQGQAVAQSRHDQVAAQLDLESRRIGVLAEIRDLVARAQRAETLTTLYREGVLPQERSALDAAAAAYASAQVEFVTLLDVFRSLLDDEIEYEAQRAQQVQALAGLEALTGVHLVLAGDDSAGGRGQP